MNRFSPLLVLLLVSLASAEPPSAQPSALALGKRQILDGALSDAVATLDAVVLELTPQADTRRAELVEALVYKGWALVGLGNEEPAKASFREALKLDGSLRLTRGEFPDRVIRVFDAARSGKTKSVMERPTNTGKKAGIGATGIAGIVAGVALIGGGAVVAAGGSESKNQPPSVSTVTASPSGQAIVSVTKVALSAQVADPEGGALTCSWSFGDGGTAVGQTVTHVFSAAGTFTVQVTVTDPSGGTATGSTTVTVRSMTGTWVDAQASQYTWALTQAGSTLQGSYFPRSSPTILAIGPVTGTLADPRTISFTVTVTFQTGTRVYLFEGTVDDTLQTISAVDRSDPYSSSPTLFRRQ